MCQRLQHRSFNGDGRHPTRYYPSVPTAGYSSRCDTKGYSSCCCAIRRVQVTEEATACGRTNHSPQSKEITAFDEWNCRADVACVGADLRVRPQNRLRSGEDRRTHRSAPTVGSPTPLSGSPEEQSTELAKREKLRFLLAYELRKRVTCLALTQQMHDHASIQRDTRLVVVQ